MREHYHFIGIGGIGMSGLARILLQKGISVTGSDLSASYVTEGLIKAGAKIFIGQSFENVPSDSTVVFSTDIKHNNPEFEAAKLMNRPLLHRSELLSRLMGDSKTISVAGTHGKTTTTALLTTVLIHAGLDPSYAVGGMLPQFQTNASHGTGEYFVAEADESDGTFLNYHSYGAIVTNIDLDHMNHFITESALIAAFKQFISKVAAPEKHLFWCGDDARLKALSLPGFSYGYAEGCDLIITNAQQLGWNLEFDIQFQDRKYKNIALPLIGQHNVLNASAVFGMALTLGIPEEKIRQGMLAFKGVKRRCEKKAEFNEILFIDDYAHHPTEIETTLKGIRAAIGKRRLVAIFQPHRYSRTKDCLGSYGNIFNSADLVFITDVFAAGEAPIEKVNGQIILEEIRSQCKAACFYVCRTNLAELIASVVHPKDLIVTLGAGDITKVSSEIMEKLQPIQC